MSLIIPARPVARGSLMGSEDFPNFPKFTNLVAVIHSLLHFFVCVKMRLRTFQFQNVFRGWYPRTPATGRGRPPSGPSPTPPTAVCRGASAPDVETSAHQGPPSNMGWLRACVHPISAHSSFRLRTVFLLLTSDCLSTISTCPSQMLFSTWNLCALYSGLLPFYP